MSPLYANLLLVLLGFILIISQTSYVDARTREVQQYGYGYGYYPGQPGPNPNNNGLPGPAQLATPADNVNGTVFTCEAPANQPQKKWPTPTVITTFNTKFIIQARLGQGPFANNPAATQAHIDAIAKEISELNSDIVQVQEIGDCVIFGQLRDRIYQYNKKLDYQYYLVKTPDVATNQSTGLLTLETPSKPVFRQTYSTHYPLPRSTCKNTSFSGDTELTKHNIALFEGQFEKQFGFKLALIGVLFQTEGNGCIIREAEATDLKKIATNLYQSGYEIIIQGDINDVSNKFKDVNNTVPTGQVSNIIEDGYPQLFNEAVKTPYNERYSVTGPEVIMDLRLQFPLEVRYIDYVYTTPGVGKAFQRSDIPHNQPTDLQPSGFFNYSSNHWPVVSYFDFTKVKGKGY